MNATALRRLIVTELLLALREPGAMFMALILPLAVFLALGFSVGVIEIPVERDTGVVEMFHVRDVLLAGNIAWVAAVFGIIALPQTLVEFRQHGIFRRYRVTPMPSYMLIIAPLAVGAAVIVVSLALMLVVGWLVLNIRFGGSAAMVALAIFVSYLAFAALGTAVTARIRNTRTGLGLGLVLFAPMLVLSGAFGPRQAFPTALQLVGDWLPLTHAYDLLTFLWLGATWETETTIGVPVWVSFAYLGGIAAVCVAASVRLFRWD
ncbi:MAG: ABC transporter permease [Chloroflexota bacterium]|nr:ABC transporter permease [Chloroflexota bacterium]MDE2930005.1 ABC transporter permease [Chloroflexota bacterium]